MSENIVNKGYEPNSLDPIPSVMKVIPTARIKFLNFLMGAISFLLAVKVYTLIPKKDIVFKKIMGFEKLGFTIPLEVMTYPVLFLMGLSIGYIIWVYLYQKMSSYSLNERNITYRRGVININDDSTDLTHIQDYKLSRNFAERLMGLSRVLVISRDKTHPEMLLTGLRKDDCEKLINFLRKYAFNSYVDFRVARDRDQMRQKQSVHSKNYNKRMKNIKNEFGMVSDDGEES